MAFFIIVLISGIALRIFYIYQLPPCMDLDSSTIGLMTKDILQGKIPVFFQGQNYNGSLEAIWLSFFVAIFGLNVATLYMGMLSLYIFFALTVYWMGCLIKNKFVGLWSLAYCSISPHLLLHNSVIPYGYHMVILIFGDLILCFSLLICQKGASKGIRFYWMLLGFVAGIGFWSHSLIIFYIISAGVFLLINKKIRDLVRNGFTVLISFILGSFPFWLHNLKTHFSSFNIYSGQPYKDYRVVITYCEAFKRILNYQLPAILGIIDSSVIIRISVWVIFIISGLFFILIPENGNYFSYIGKIWRNKKILWVFLFISIIGLSVGQRFFIQTSYCWYFLPLYSIIPIWIAYIVDWFNCKARYMGILFLIMILLFNAQNITKGVRFDKDRYGRMHRFYQGVIHFFRSNKIDGFVGDFAMAQVVSFLTSGGIVGAEILNGRGADDEELQSRDRLAILGQNLETPLSIICKDYKRCTSLIEDEFPYASCLYDFQQYGYYGSSINPDCWKAKCNYKNKDVFYGFDRNLDRYWAIDENRNPGTYYQLDLGSSRNVYKLVIFNTSPYLWNMPEYFKIVVSTDGINWHTVKKVRYPQPLFWSGPRLYWDSINGRWEVLFKPVTARYIRMVETGRGLYRWVMNEIFVYECLGERQYKLKDYIKPAKEAYKYLLDNKINFVYADFWLSAKIRSWSKCKIEALRIENNCYPLRKYTSRNMELGRNTAIIAGIDMEAELENVLKEFNLPIKKRFFGEYICYLFKDLNDWQKYFFSHQQNLYWAGVCPIKKSLKLYSQILYSYGLKLERERDIEDAVSYYKQGLEMCPRNNLARIALVNYYKNKGQVIEYKKQLLKLKHLCFPLIEKKIEFENGVTFLGYRIFRCRNILRADYYWKTFKKLHDYTVAFVYFVKDNKIVFQGDYPLTFEYPNPAIPLKDWVFVERSRVKIPLDAGYGTYEIQIGLYMPDKNGMRVRMKDSQRVNKITIGEFKLQ